MNIIDSVKNTAFSAAVHTALEYLEKNPEENIPKAMRLMDQVLPDGWYEGQRAAFRKAIEEKGNWYQLIMKAYQLDAGVRKTFFQNFIVNSALKGSAIQNEVREKENCNVPWAILLDPTSACNLHCTGCWAAEYGHKLNLSLETIDDIVTQGKKLGTYMYIYTGGEPMVRKRDLITLCERHPDCEFLSFTNGTLIDEEFCMEMLRVKNFVPAISLEGFEKANDGRRGKGVFEKVMQAMDLLRPGEMYMVRYADDFVCLFQYENEARKFYQLLIERLKKFGLEIAEDKSRILPFGRYKGTKESFDFLGFTHYNAKSHWGKYCVLHRTSKKKLKIKREEAKKWIWEHMHESIADTVETLNIKLAGHYRYYGIYGNYIGLIKYFVYVRQEVWKSKRRRDQSYWLTWKKYREILKIHPLETPKIYVTSAY